MRLGDRVRGRLARARADVAWDDHGAEPVATRMAALAAAYDPELDDRRPAASRAAMLGAFAAATAGQPEPRQGTPGRDLPTTGRVPVIRWGGRRPALVLVAAGLLLVMSIGTVAASAPGGPLYGLRLASEELLLPESPGDRARAQVDRLDTRLSEASDAAAHGDLDAAVAALRAYATIATEASSGISIDEATAAQLALRVRAELEIISAIGTGAPALEGARVEAQVAARALLGALGEPDEGPGPGPGPSGPAPTSPGGMPSTPGSPAPGSPAGSGGPGGPGSPSPAGYPSGPNGSPAPGGTAGPNASPAPGGTAGPNASPAPGGTAGPNPSSGPTGSSGPTQTPGTSSDATTPTATPHATGAPSPSTGGGSGSGSGGDGATASPQPSSSGQAASDPAPSSSPGSHP